MHDQLVVKLRPEFRDRTLADGRRNDAGVDHLQEILVLEARIGLLDRHRAGTGLLETIIERDEIFVVAARATHVNFAPGEIGFREDGGRAFPCDDDIFDP